MFHPTRKTIIGVFIFNICAYISYEILEVKLIDDLVRNM